MGGWEDRGSRDEPIKRPDEAREIGVADMVMAGLLRSMVWELIRMAEGLRMETGGAIEIESGDATTIGEEIGMTGTGVREGKGSVAGMGIIG
jgi:hypothetical protein